MKSSFKLNLTIRCCLKYKSCPESWSDSLENHHELNLPCSPLLNNIWFSHRAGATCAALASALAVLLHAQVCVEEEGPCWKTGILLSSGIITLELLATLTRGFFPPSHPWPAMP